VREICETLRECVERLEVVQCALSDADLDHFARRADAIRELVAWLRIAVAGFGEQ